MALLMPTILLFISALVLTMAHLLLSAIFQTIQQIG